MQQGARRFMAKSRKGAGALVVSLLVRCAEAGDEAGAADKRDLSGEANKTYQNSDTRELAVSNIQLDKLPSNIGASFPNLEKLILDCILAPAAPPNKKCIRGITPCTATRHLEVSGSFGSATNLQWFKVLFPKLSTLRIEIGALPLRKSGIKQPQRKKLAMKSIETVVVEEEESSKIKSLPLLFENLKLFPCAKSLRFHAISSRALEDKRGTDLRLPLVESLDLDVASAPIEFLRRLPEMFPSLKELLLCDEAFLEIISDKEERSCMPPFEVLEKVQVRPKAFVPIVFTSRTADIFPSLVALEILSPRIEVSLPPGATRIEPLPRVKNLVLDCGLSSRLPEFLGWLFPALESLEMPNCGLQQFSDKSDFEHLCLKRLDISDNPSLSEDTVTKQHDPPAGGIRLPQLELLDIRGSLAQGIPCRLFDGCSQIRSLKITFDPTKAYNRPEWWEFLKALPHLQVLVVDIEPYYPPLLTYNLEKEQGFTGNRSSDIVADLAKTLIAVRASLPNKPTIEISRERIPEPLLLLRGTSAEASGTQ